MPLRRKVLSMRSTIIQTVLLLVVTATLLGQAAKPTDLTTLKGVVSVTVAALSHPDASALVRVTRIELADDYLRLEIENTTPVPVIAVDIRYELSSCLTEGFSATGGAVDTRRVPGMASIDVPAHSRVWYEHDHMASRLAYDAIAQKTRYLQARTEIIAAVFANGEETRWEDFGPKPKHPMEAVESGVCEKWLWNDVLNEVRGFRPPPHEPGRRLNENHAGKTSVTYTCSVDDDVLYCPD